MAVSIGLPFGVLVSSGAFAGHYLDSKWSTAPWLTLSGLGLGAVAAFANMFRILAWWRRNDGNDMPPPP